VRNANGLYEEEVKRQLLEQKARHEQELQKPFAKEPERERILKLLNPNQLRRGPQSLRVPLRNAELQGPKSDIIVQITAGLVRGASRRGRTQASAPTQRY
jgi:hypothetical protein